MSAIHSLAHVKSHLMSRRVWLKTDKILPVTTKPLSHSSIRMTAMTSSTFDNARSTKTSETIKCAFCHGVGTDPYGVLSELSICSSCGGKGTVIVPAAHTRCIYCEGTGSHKTFRCLVCEGAGVIPLPSERTKKCPSCEGTAFEQSSGLACLTCRGHGSVPA
jgi:DnaJ-class molecular chaperone